MTFPSVTLKPGPKILAAAFKIAGFSEDAHLSAVVDACGVTWPHPSELQTAVALVGGEASGHTWCWHQNTNDSTDWGALQINSSAHPEWFGPITDPLQLNWANFVQNGQMAFKVYMQAGRSFKPWKAFTNGGYKAMRYGNHSWLDWGQHGVSAMLADIARLKAQANPPSEFQALAAIASINLDPLVYW